MVVRLQTTRNQVSAALAALAPEDRITPLLDLLEDASQDIFWPVFLDWVPLCANIWPHRRRLLLRLSRAGEAYPYMCDEGKRAFDDFAIEQYVLRGCSTRHQKGFSWADTYEAADGFARWHSARGRRANVYEAIIYKPAIFAVIVSREGPTILLDYTRLQDIHRVEDRPAYADCAPTFAPDAHYYDENDDGKTAELTLTEAPQRRTRKIAPPPIENMRQSELEAMLAGKIEQLKTAQLRLQIAAIEADIRRARKEIAARERGALPGRGTEKHGASWDQKRRAGGGRPMPARP